MWCLNVVVVVAAVLFTLSIAAVPSSATRYLTEAEITRQVCYSSSHAVNGQLYISAPPTGPVDVVVIPGTYKRYTIDCINIVQSGPALLEYQKSLCSNLATPQEFYVCTSPASLGDGRSWTCAGPISEYTRDTNYQYVVGGEYGDELNIKIQWRPSPSAGVVCFPQYINAIVTGQDGTLQKTNLGLIISMSILGFIIIAAGAYVGLYTLRKSCNKFFVHMEKGKGHHTTQRSGKARDVEEDAGEVGGVSSQLNTMRNARPPTAEEQSGVRDKGLLKDTKRSKKAKRRDPYLEEDDESEEDVLKLGAPPMSGRYTNRNATEVEEGVFSARRLDPYDHLHGSQSRGGEDGLNESPSSKHHASIVIVPVGSGGDITSPAHHPTTSSSADGYGGTKFAHSSRKSHTNNNATSSSAVGGRNQKHYGDVLVPATVGGVPSSVLYGSNYADVNPVPPHSGPQETFLPTHLVSVPMRKGWLDAYDSQRARERARVERRNGGGDYDADDDFDDEENSGTSANIPASLEAQAFDRRLAAQPRHHEVAIDQHLSRRDTAVSGGGAPPSDSNVARRLPIQLDESRPDYLSPPNRDANGRIAKGKGAVSNDRHQGNVEGLEWVVIDGHGRDPAGHDLSPYARHHDRFAVGDSVSIIYQDEGSGDRRNAPY